MRPADGSSAQAMRPSTPRFGDSWWTAIPFAGAVRSQIAAYIPSEVPMTTTPATQCPDSKGAMVPISIVDRNDLSEFQCMDGVLGYTTHPAKPE